MTELARVESEQDGSRCVVRVLGEVDMSNAHELGRAIGAAVPKGARELVLDLTRTTYLDSAGVALLLRLANRLQARRQSLRVLAPPDAPVRGVLELTGVAEMVDLVAGLDPARGAEGLPGGA